MKDTIREMWPQPDAVPENFADNDGKTTSADESITYAGHSARPPEEAA